MHCNTQLINCSRGVGVRHAGADCGGACRIDLERWVHAELLKLRCDMDVRQAALAHDASLPPRLRRTSSLTSRHLQYKPLGLDLLAVF